VLDALRKTQLKATFFLNAKHLEGHPKLQFSLIKRIITEGHSVGNHGYDHDPTTVAEYDLSNTEAVRNDFTKNVERLKHLFKLHGQSFPGLPVARLPGDGRTIPAFVSMIVHDVGVPHVGWDFEFAPNGVFPWVPFNDWQGIREVAASNPGFPKADDVLLLHDKHWKGRGHLLVKLFDKLKKQFAVVSLSPMPRTAHCIQFPN
jgi:peptidoglycan/xylan/chitin deacetylase (PgdA/CDA1 family)